MMLMFCEGKLSDRMLRERFGIVLLLAFVVFSLASATEDLAPPACSDDDDDPCVDPVEEESTDGEDPIVPATALALDESEDDVIDTSPAGTQ